MAKLTTKERKSLPKKDFAVPGKRAYPVEDKNHARAALSRVSANGSAAEKKEVRAKVHAKFPDIGKSNKPGESRKPGENKYARERRLDTWAKGE